MSARTNISLILATAVCVLAMTVACTAPPVQDVRAEEPPQCKMDERYICVGKSASRLKTGSETDHEICRCARLNELPQMGPNTP